MSVLMRPLEVPLPGLEWMQPCRGRAHTADPPTAAFLVVIRARTRGAGGAAEWSTRSLELCKECAQGTAGATRTRRA